MRALTIVCGLVGIAHADANRPMPHVNAGLEVMLGSDTLLPPAAVVIGWSP